MKQIVSYLILITLIIIGSTGCSEKKQKPINFNLVDMTGEDGKKNIFISPAGRFEWSKHHETATLGYGVPISLNAGIYDFRIQPVNVDTVRFTKINVSIEPDRIPIVKDEKDIVTFIIVNNTDSIFSKVEIYPNGTIETINVTEVIPNDDDNELTYTLKAYQLYDSYYLLAFGSDERQFIKNNIILRSYHKNNPKQDEKIVFTEKDLVADRPLVRANTTNRLSKI